MAAVAAQAISRARLQSPKRSGSELPISIKVSGGYHELGGFASDVSNLARIVTLNNMNIQVDKSGQLSMEAVAKTFRYLDPEEIAISRREAAKAKAAAAKGGAK